MTYSKLLVLFFQSHVPEELSEHVEHSLTQPPPLPASQPPPLPVTRRTSLDGNVKCGANVLQCLSFAEILFYF